MKIFIEFFFLGLTSFGGPVAHIAIFRNRFVEKAKLFSESTYAELVAMAQIIPGPTSSQVGMAIGYRLNGLRGAISAWFGFTLPSAVAMGIAGYLVLTDHIPEAGWVVSALKSVALGVVTQAVIGMWGSICINHLTRVTALLTAIIINQFPLVWTQVILISSALLAGHFAFLNSPVIGLRRNLACKQLKDGFLLLCIFFILLILAFSVPYDHNLWKIITGHFISGSLVFGGGHVVLPLLEAEFVPPLPDNVFLAGYGIAQAMPGPLFSIASYIGSTAPGVNPLVGALSATTAVFLPGALLLSIAGRFGTVLLPWLKPRLSYVNAVVVGLLLSVLVDPVFATTVYDEGTTGLAILSLFMAVGLKRSPLEIVVVLLTASYLGSLVGFI